MHFTKLDFLTLWTRASARQHNIDWYANHLGLAVGWDSPGEKLTLLQFPSQQAITLLAHYPEDGALPEGGVRVCLTTPHLHDTKRELEQSGIPTTEVYETPWGTKAFDFCDPQGTRLTSTSLPAGFEAERRHRHRFYSYFLHITVDDLPQAERWYSSFLGMTAVDPRIAGQYRIMGMPDDTQAVRFPIFLSQGTESTKPVALNREPAVISAVRPFFQLAGKHQLEQTHAFFQSNGIVVTEIIGNSDDFMRWFDFADPSGNSLFAIAY